MSNQEEKQFKQLAGEYGVASELCRRQIHASITYGNSKKADVYAIDKNRAVRIEVKSTTEKKWPIGNRNISGNDKNAIWVFVHLDKTLKNAPKYYVLTSSEVKKIRDKNNEEYNKNYSIKHKTPFDQSKGVPSLKPEQIEEHENKWEKIKKAL